MMKTKQIITAIVTVLALAGVGFYLINTVAPTAPTKLVAQRPLTATSSFEITDIEQPGEPPEGYVKYQNDTYGFLFYHSPQATVKEYDEGGGAATIVLENEKTIRGMQIFIVPYTFPTITEERFAKDVPSGVRENVEKTYVGIKHIEAVTFNSYDQFLGDTREVWFIYNGYLFEITTFAGVRDWLVPILKTWRFL